jgi:hypothetical protein
MRRVLQRAISLANLVLDSIAGHSFPPRVTHTSVLIRHLYSFLVADRVYVSSIAAKSDTQYVFSSSADEGSFEIYPDPRGNTLGRGTEITLVLKDDASEYLDDVALAKLVCVSSHHFTCLRLLTLTALQYQALWFLFFIPDLSVYSED